MTLALIFDCDGVLSDTERYGHLPAYNQMFREMGLPIQWSVEEYGDKLRICGGKERLTSLLTDDFVRAARAANRNRLADGGSCALVQTQDRNLHTNGSRRLPPAAPWYSTYAASGCKTGSYLRIRDGTRK